MTIQKLGLAQPSSSLISENPSHSSSDACSSSSRYHTHADPCVAVDTVSKRRFAPSSISLPENRKASEAESLTSASFKSVVESNCQNFDDLMTKGDNALEESSFEDAEKNYAHALKAISRKNNPEEALCAKKLGSVYLERAKQEPPNEESKEDCIKAAGLLNYGLNLAHKHENTALAAEISQKLIEVQKTLFSLCGAKGSLEESLWGIEDRQKLRNIRKKAEPEIIKLDGEEIRVRPIYEKITSQIKTLIKRIVQTSRKCLGKPPGDCKFVVMGLGSMARTEMTPYSDIEFAILIEEGKDKEEVRQYFRNLTYLMHLRVLNLGETLLPILGIKALEGFYDEITVRGLAFDGKSETGRGYKTPLGKKDRFELIQTPMKMANFQGKNVNQYWYEEEPFLPTELHNVTLICGEESLITNYRLWLNIRLNEASGEDCTLRDYYAKTHLLSEDVRTFDPLVLEMAEGMFFDLKKDLYRMIHLFVERLFIKECKNLPQKELLRRTFSKISWLVKKRVFSENGAKNVREMFARITSARLRDSVEGPSIKGKYDPIAKESCEIDEATLNVYLSFVNAISENLTTGRSLEGRVFETENLCVLANINLRLGKLLKFRECALQHLELNPSSADALSQSIYISLELSDEDAARSHASKLIEVTKGFDEPLEEKINALMLAARVYFELDDHSEFAELIHQINRLAKASPCLAEINKMCNRMLNAIGKPTGVDEIKKIFRQYAKNRDNKPRLVHPKLSNEFNAKIKKDLSCTYLFQNHLNESLESAKESLLTFQSLYGEQHHLIGESKGMLGTIHCLTGSEEEGTRYLNECYEILKNCLGEFNKKTIEAYLSLGRIGTKKIDISPKYLEEAEKTKTHSAIFYADIGLAWKDIGSSEKAEQLFLKAKEIAEANVFSSDLGNIYFYLSDFYSESQKKEKALRYADLALEQFRNASSPTPLYVAGTILRIVSFKIAQFSLLPPLERKEQINSITIFLDEAEEICTNAGDVFYMNTVFAEMYYQRGLFEDLVNPGMEQSIEFFEKSIKKIEAFYGPNAAESTKALGAICYTCLKMPCRRKVDEDHFAKFKALVEKHMDPSSEPYGKASQIWEAYEKMPLESDFSDKQEKRSIFAYFSDCFYCLFKKEAH